VNPSFSIGRIAGIRVGLHWSWLVVLALIVWTLSSAVFPRENPGLSEATYRTMGTLAALLFFASLLLHELGHALQARREGLEIEGITLWLFGGVASFRGQFPSAGAEFRIAVAGPLVSLVLGVLFAAFAMIAGLPRAVDGVAFWLGFVNVSLLVFNLLPALPLDGGRILRAGLWKLRGDLGWATSIAAELGRLTGFFLIAAGVLLLLVEGAFSGAWLAFLGWFLLSAATGEARYAAARDALSGLYVRDLMVGDPVTARRNDTLGEFMDSVAHRARFTSYPVLDDSRVVGLLPIRSVLETPRAEWDRRRVGDRMLGLEQAPRFAPDDDLFEALSRLSNAGLNRGLVLEDDRLAGYLSITDVARLLAARQRA
jgi:Zn-dependent protease